MKRQLSFSIISRNQIWSGRELRFLPSFRLKPILVNLTHEATWWQKINNRQISRLVVNRCVLEPVQGCGPTRKYWIICVKRVIGWGQNRFCMLIWYTKYIHNALWFARCYSSEHVAVMALMNTTYSTQTTSQSYSVLRCQLAFTWPSR